MIILEEQTDNTWTSTQRGIMIHLPNRVIDNDGVRVLQQARQFHGNLSKPHARTAKDLKKQKMFQMLTLSLRAII